MTGFVKSNLVSTFTKCAASRRVGGGRKLLKQLCLLIKTHAWQAFPAGGAEGIRTPDPHNAIVVLYQLSYDPIPDGSQSKLPSPQVKAFRLASRELWLKRRGKCA